MYQLKKTKPIPTYLFGFLAGSFIHEFKPPFNIYCRENQKRALVNHKDSILEILKESSVFYEKILGVKLPF